MALTANSFEVVNGWALEVQCKCLETIDRLKLEIKP